MAIDVRLLGVPLLLVRALPLALALGVVPACKGLESPPVPESTCIDACEARIGSRCTEGECRRGCRLSMDRIVEREEESVFACVLRAKTGCSDEMWASCAAKIGVHADGGPPAPVRASEDEE